MVAPRAQEKGFRHSRDLGSAVHVDNEVAASGAIHVRKVGCFWVEFLDHGLDDLVEPSVLGQSVSLICGEAKNQGARPSWS
jgi:hypothetical protein